MLHSLLAYNLRCWTVLACAFIGISISACSNNCESAKADVAKYMTQYVTALSRGEKGASISGGVEAITSLDRAKSACHNPNLTIEIILEEYSNKLLAQ